MSSAYKAFALLLCSNLFMTAAWYGHLKFKNKPLMLVIFVSWGIAFFEYCLQVPGNRIGSETLSASQLKIMQEAITFTVFAGFSAVYLGQRPTLYDGLAFLLIMAAVAVSFLQPTPLA